MLEETELLRQNLTDVRNRIESAADRVGRDSRAIRLLPVTKTHPNQVLRSLASLGYLQMGENRIQELRVKAEDLSDLNIRWVVIGRLQTNKAGQAARIASEIQSVDSLHLAQALSRHLQEAGKTIDVLIQVNTSQETNKAGFHPADVPAKMGAIHQLPGLRVRGLMTLAAQSQDAEIPRASFRMLRKLRDDLGGETVFPELSMGMSGDFEIAIEEGATTVRVGSAIFGPRTV